MSKLTLCIISVPCSLWLLICDLWTGTF